MQTEQYQAGHADLAEIWHSAQRRRTDEIVKSDGDILKTVALFCGTGLLLSLLLVVHGLDLSAGVF